MHNENARALLNRKTLFGFAFFLAIAAHVLIFSLEQLALAEVVETLLESHIAVVR